MILRPVITIEPSATVVMNSLALQKKAKGERVYNLSAGEPMIPTPDVVIQAALLAMQQGKTHYPPVQGIPELLKVASSWINQTCQTTYELKNTIATCGGKFGIYALLQALLAPTEEVLIIAPYWVSYTGMVKIFGGVPKVVSTAPEKNWKVEVRDLENAYSEKTKLLILNNASNPTGTLYTKEELKEILDFAEKNNLIVISDEVYSGLVYTGQPYISCGSFEQYRERVFVIQSCSKSFAMTGWRVGFVFGDSGIIKVLTTLQGQSTTGTSIISQYAAVAAIENAKTITPAVNTAMGFPEGGDSEELSEGISGHEVGIRV